MGAPAARAAELARHWTEAGHQVTILTGFPNHPTGVVPAEYRSRFRRVVAREQVDGVDVARTWLLPLPNRRAHERILNYSSFAASAALRGMFLPRPDVVIATSPQLLVGLSGYWLAWAKVVPFIFEVRDLWPESLAAVGMGKKNSMMQRAIGTIAGFLYQRSNHIVVVSPAFKEHLINQWQIQASKISVVVNGVETKLFSPEAVHENRRQKLGLGQKFVVGYIGTLGMAHGLQTMIHAAVELQRREAEVVFLVVGEGAEKAQLMRSANDLGLRNIMFVEQQKREKIPEFINACDACLVLLKRAEVFETVIPTKMLEFMSCGRPVILGVEGQARQIVEQARAGVCIEPENTTALVDAIIRLRADEGARKQMGWNGRHHIVSQYSRQGTAEGYISVLERVLGIRRTAVA